MKDLKFKQTKKLKFSRCMINSEAQILKLIQNFPTFDPQLRK